MKIFDDKTYIKLFLYDIDMIFYCKNFSFFIIFTSLVSYNVHSKVCKLTINNVSYASFV